LSLEQRLAWRNVWRNKRRTALCVAATVFAVALVVISVAMQMGTHEKMIEDGVRVHSGHVTIADPAHLKERTLEHFIVPRPSLLRALEDQPAVAGWAPRVSSFALVSHGTSSRGAAIVGVDPEREGSVTTLPDRVSAGRFVADTPGSREIVLGARLAKSLGAAVGDELLLYGVAYSLETAYELFTVVGLVKLPEPELERSIALITLAVAQEFYAYGDRLSEIAVLATAADETGPLVTALRAELGADSSVVDAPEIAFFQWDEVMPELANLVALDAAGMYVILVILVVVVAFGILNTILMAILERTRELGMMLALGLRPGAVFRLVVWESVFMAGVGLVVGLAIALPVVLYLVGHPIRLEGELSGMSEFMGMEPVAVFKLTPWNPIGSAITILVVGSLASIYPARKASRARAVDALRAI
jgi:putative ABC transport system permease protein